MSRKLDVSEEWKGQCDQDLISELANGEWGKIRLVWEVGQVLAGSHDLWAPTIARPWVRIRTERCESDRALRPGSSRRSWACWENNRGKGPSPFVLGSKAPVRTP